ncbi:GAF domain-containing protein [Leptolyngbya sp. PCC 7375]|nr:GAF domain-containing protein [Leptolyngbya sp. PCC 7375]
MSQFKTDDKQDKSDEGLRHVVQRFVRNIERDALVIETLDLLRSQLNIDRVALYYFYGQWKGQVTAEALSDSAYSIYGYTGADNCFNDEYAALYLKGRIHGIDNVATAEIAPCHREFLESIQVQANLVAPILVSEELWGLISAHNCQDACTWSSEDIARIKSAAQQIATAPSINFREEG